MRILKIRPEPGLRRILLIPAVAAALCLSLSSCGDRDGRGCDPHPEPRPTVVITEGPSGSTPDNTPTFSWYAYPGAGGVFEAEQGVPPEEPGPSPGIAEYYYDLNNSLPEIRTTEESLTLGPLPDGDYTFYLLAVDDEGIFSEAASRSFTVDTTGE